MKTLEVVRDKKIFLLKKSNFFPALNNSLYIDSHTKLLYNIDGLNIKNCVELIERLAPFFYHLISIYLRKNGGCHLLFKADVHFPHMNDFFLEIMRINMALLKGSRICGTWGRSAIEWLEHWKNYYYNYNITFHKPITLVIYLKQAHVFGMGCYPLLKREEEKQIIKTIESYREEDRVLCLKEKSNIFFCKCGHICICKKCKEEYKPKSYLICKKYGVILREV